MYTQSITTLITRMTLPSPKRSRRTVLGVEGLDRIPGVDERDERRDVEEVAVQVLQDEREARLAVYFAWGSATAQAVGDCHTER